MACTGGQKWMSAIQHKYGATQIGDFRNGDRTPISEDFAISDVTF